MLKKGIPIGVICKICGYFTITGTLILNHEKETGHHSWTDAYLTFIEE